MPAGARAGFEAVYHAFMTQAEGCGVDTGVWVQVMRRLVSLGLSPAALKSLSGCLTLGTLRGLLHLAYLSACEAGVRRSSDGGGDAGGGERGGGCGLSSAGTALV
ncbi:MAG: hypothetical protein ABR558_11130, partial [Thioalkalivibrio sp.]